jgi:hypothetical protein
MGIRAIFRAGQQSIAKTITTNFGTSFSAEDQQDLANNVVAGTTKKTTRGRTWTFVRGTWGLSNNKLASSTSASQYPIAIVDALVPDVNIELKDIGQGIGAAIWVTDSGNWWATASQQETESCNCSTTSYDCNCLACEGYTCNGYNCACGNGNYTPASGGGCATYSCSTQYGNYCSAYYANGNCRSYTKIAWQDCTCSSYAPYNGGNYTAESYSCCCGTTYYYSCQCQTCQTTSCQTCYPQYMRIIQSAANTVSEILKWQVSGIVKSIRVITSNKNITVKSYSDVSLQTEINSKNYAATSAQETTRFGVVVSPSSYNQSGTVSEIKIERGV